MNVATRYPSHDESRRSLPRWRTRRFRAIYLGAIGLVVASFLLQMLMGICPVP